MSVFAVLLAAVIGLGDTHSFTAHDGRLATLQVSPAAATLLLSTGEDGHAKMWSVGDPRPLWDFDGGTYLRSAAFAPDGNAAAVGAGDGKVHLLDTRTGRLVHELTGDIYREDSVEALAFSSDGAYVAGGNYCAAFLWDVETGRRLKTFMKAGSCLFHVTAVGFYSQRRFLYVADQEELNVWDIASGAHVRSLAFPRQEITRYVDISRDGRYVALTHVAAIVILDIESGATVRTIPASQEALQDVRFADDRCCVLSASSDGTVRQWDIATGAVVSQLDGRGSTGDLYLSFVSVAAAKREALMFTGTTHGVVHYWRP